MSPGFTVSSGYIIYDEATGKFSMGGKPATWSLRKAKVWDSLGKLRLHLKLHSVSNSKGSGIPDSWKVYRVKLTIEGEQLDAQEIFWSNGGYL